jgi:predicted metal-binding membrane protein
MLITRGRGLLDAGGPLMWATVLVAWILALGLPLLGHGDLVSHHAILGGPEPPQLSTLLLFLVAWQAMTGAMMLPSSLPLVGLFARVSSQQARPRLVLAVFLAAYFAVWTGFAIVALAGDAVLHGVIGRWAWLGERPWLVAGSILLVAGAFQFSSLKERCLDACRTPVQFIRRFYDRGLPAAWRLGVRHGLFCLGCCWALMLTMFAVGVGSLAWMVGLTGIMLIEKTSPHGRRLAPVVGSALLLWGALILLQPAWLPAAFSGR